MKPYQRAANTDRWTEILFRALTSRVAKRWRMVSFRGTGGGEWCGIVDVVAIRKDTSRTAHEILRSGDLFNIILVQMKGGSARGLIQSDLRRLEAVKKRYRAQDVVLFSWKKSERCEFSRLVGGRWVRSAASSIFG